MKKHIPEFVIGFYGFCMIVAFIMIAIIIRNNKKSKKYKSIQKPTKIVS
jgi:hypothetical protein